MSNRTFPYQQSYGPYVLVHQSAQQTTTTGVNFQVPYNTEDSDKWNMHAGSDAFVTIPVGWDGIWEFWGGVRWGASAAGAIRQIQLALNVTTTVAVDKASPVATHIQGCTSGPISCVAGDAMYLIATQDSGGNLVIDPTNYSMYLRGYFLGTF